MGEGMRERLAHQRLSVQAVEVWRGGGVEGRKGGQVWWCVDGARLKDEREMDEGWRAIGTRKAISASRFAQIWLRFTLFVLLSLASCCNQAFDSRSREL